VSLFGGGAQLGDWVVTTKPVKVTLADHLLGDEGGIRAGTHGVVVGRSGWDSLQVRLDTGILGSTTVRVRAHQVRVTRRGGGVAAFAARSSRLNAARGGVAAALLLPFLYFAVTWFLHGGSRAGLLMAIVEGSANGMLDLLGYVLSHPINGLIYVALLAAASRFAFR
jgi:hypothetical protein